MHVFGSALLIALLALPAAAQSRKSKPKPTDALTPPPVTAPPAPAPPASAQPAAPLPGTQPALPAAKPKGEGTTLGLYRLAEPHAFQGLLSRPDYGVSAISAAWLGAVAAAGWTRRGQTLEGRAAIALACAAIALFAWMLRGALTVLDSDHIFAFAVGLALALTLPRGAMRPFQRQKALVDLHRA